MKKPVIFILTIIIVGLLFGQVIPDNKLYENGFIPSVCVTDDSNIHIAYSGLNTKTKYLTYDSLLNVISDTLFIENTENYIVRSIDVNMNKVALAWAENNPLHDNIYTTVFDNTSGEIDTILNIYSTNYATDPQVCFLSDTLLLSIWSGSISQNMNIYGQLFDASNNLLDSIFMINDNDRNDITCSNPVIHSLSPNEGFIATWLEDSCGVDRVLGRLFDVNGYPLDSSFLISDNPNISDVYHLSMDYDESGIILVVWSAKVGSIWDLYSRWYSNNTIPLTDVIKLTEATDSVSVYSNIGCSISENGESVIVWESDSKGYMKIRSQRFSNDRVKIGESFQISPAEKNNYEMNPRVLINNHKIYNFWGEYQNGVWANVLDFNNPITSIDSRNNLPTKFSLSQNFPNPFNASTKITFLIEESDYVTFNIYDISGNKVIVLFSGYFQPGEYSFLWNGRDSKNIEIPTGQYFGDFTCLGRNKVLKMLIIK